MRQLCLIWRLTVLVPGNVEQCDDVLRLRWVGLDVVTIAAIWRTASSAELRKRTGLVVFVVVDGAEIPSVS